MTRLEDHPRYRDWKRPFLDAARTALRPGAVVLDLGGGRRPALARAALPNGARYIGLDVSREELDGAPAGAYDEAIVADVGDLVPDLVGHVDLAVSWQVLEHVESMERATRNIHAYLRPGGRFVAQLSGGRALFALVNRAVPHTTAVAAMHRLLGRNPSSVFPAPYDRCTYSQLRPLFREWSSVVIVPRYAGATYLGFFPPLQRLYLRLEDLMVRGRHADIATHYLVIADR